MVGDLAVPDIFALAGLFCVYCTAGLLLWMKKGSQPDPHEAKTWRYRPIKTQRTDTLPR